VRGAQVGKAGAAQGCIEFGGQPLPRRSDQGAQGQWASEKRISKGLDYHRRSS
jgi:hypothetical protein